MHNNFLTKLKKNDLMGILDYVLSEDLSIGDYVTQLKTKVPDVLCPLTLNTSITSVKKQFVTFCCLNMAKSRTVAIRSEVPWYGRLKNS